MVLERPDILQKSVTDSQGYSSPIPGDRRDNLLIVFVLLFQYCFLTYPQKTCFNTILSAPWLIDRTLQGSVRLTLILFCLLPTVTVDWLRFLKNRLMKVDPSVRHPMHSPSPDSPSIRSWTEIHSFAVVFALTNWAQCLYSKMKYSHWFALEFSLVVLLKVQSTQLAEY